MKTYIRTIQYTQKILLGISIAILALLPPVLAFAPDALSSTTILHLYDLSHLAIFFVMIIRPIADIYTGNPYVRPLVILRKGVGVLSAAIVVSFIFAKIITDPVGYVTSFGTLAYWSFAKYAVIAHLADISALLLIVTSNNLSKKLLGAGWKKVQKLSYMYFYASAIYVYLAYGSTDVLFSMLIVTILTTVAYLFNRERRTSTLTQALPV